MEVRRLAGAWTGLITCSTALFPIVGTAQLEEIIVTATRRAESLQDIPISAVSQTGERLNELNLLSAPDMAQFIPGLEINDSLTVATVMRGVGTTSAGVSFEPSVAAFIDGSYLGRDRVTNAAFFDMERIEILRGPQPLYAGQNAVAGVMNIISNRPTETWEGFVRTLAGSDEEYIVEAAVGGPISDDFGIRLAGLYDDRGGYIDIGDTGRTGRASENQAFRGTLVWDPTEDLTITAIGSWYDSYTQGTEVEYARCAPSNPRRGFNPCSNDPEVELNDVAWGGVNGGAAGPVAAANGFLIPPLPQFGPLGGLPAITFGGNIFPGGAFDPTQITIGEGDLRTQEGSRASLYFDYRFGGGDYTLSSQTNYFTFDSYIAVDADYSSLDMFNPISIEDYAVTQQELRVTSDLGGSVEWMAGIYWQDSELDNDNPSSTIALAPLPFLLGTRPPNFNFPVPPFPNDVFYDENATWTSAFAKVDIDLSDTVTLGLGGRYTEVDKDATIRSGTGFFVLNSMGVIVGNNVDDGLGPNACAFGTALFYPDAMGGPPHPYCVANELSNDSFDPEVTLQVDVADNTMLYVKYVEAFKAGGFAVGMDVPAPSQFVYFPETAESVELGLKTSMLDGNLELNFAVYSADYEDRQVISQVSDFTGAPVFLTQNAAESSSQGIEIDGRWAPTDNLLFTFAASTLDAVYDSFPGASCNGYKNARLQNGCGTVIGVGPAGPIRQLTFDAAGLAPELASDWDVYLGTRYAIPLSNNLMLTFNADFAVSAGYDPGGTGIVSSLSVIEEPEFQNDNIERLNLRLGIGPADRRWEAALYGENVTDNRAFQSVGPAPVGYEEDIVVIRRQGATYGAQFRYNFGD